MTRTVTIVVGAVTAPVAAEALRGAVGLTLRGDALTVVLDPAAPVDGPEPTRARATLALFHHRVTGTDDLAAALDADAIEIWGAAAAAAAVAPPRQRALLHLVRPGHRALAVAAADRVVHLDDALDDDQLLDLVLAAGSVAVW